MTDASNFHEQSCNVFLLLSLLLVCTHKRKELLPLIFATFFSLTYNSNGKLSIHLTSTQAVMMLFSGSEWCPN